MKSLNNHSTEDRTSLMAELYACIWGVNARLQNDAYNWILKG